MPPFWPPTPPDPDPGPSGEPFAVVAWIPGVAHAIAANESEARRALWRFMVQNGLDWDHGHKTMEIIPYYNRDSNLIEASYVNPSPHQKAR